MLHQCGIAARVHSTKKKSDFVDHSAKATHFLVRARSKYHTKLPNANFEGKVDLIPEAFFVVFKYCLLYTSDAADE